MKELRLVALTRGHRMKCLLRRMLDPEEFLSDYGVRSLSKFHQAHPYSITLRGEEKIVSYEPAESQSGFFGRQLELARTGLVSDQLPPN